jgi:hypothetical protein
MAALRLASPDTPPTATRAAPHVSLPSVLTEAPLRQTAVELQRDQYAGRRQRRGGCQCVIAHSPTTRLTLAAAAVTCTLNASFASCTVQGHPVMLREWQPRRAAPRCALS